MSGAPLTDRKSKFIAHVASGVTSDDEARAFRRQLVASDKKIAAATHNILAWRLRGGACGRDDDGEGGAGDRLLQLLERMRAESVAVVVTRWMAGPKLGPVRFAHICNAARIVLAEHRLGDDAVDAERADDTDEANDDDGDNGDGVDIGAASAARAAGAKGTKSRAAAAAAAGGGGRTKSRK